MSDSDTPRTDAEYAKSGWWRSRMGYAVKLDFARQLERELNEAKMERGALAYSSHEGGWTPLGEIIVGLEREVEKLKKQLSQSYVPSEVNEQGWHLCEDTVVDGLAFYDPGEEVTLYCMVKGDVYEHTVKLPSLDISGGSS